MNTVLWILFGVLAIPAFYIIRSTNRMMSLTRNADCCLNCGSKNLDGVNIVVESIFAVDHRQAAVTYTQLTLGPRNAHLKTLLSPTYTGGPIIRITQCRYCSSGLFWTYKGLEFVIVATCIEEPSNV